MKDFEPLYPRDGGPPRAFGCNKTGEDGERCRAVCKSYRGILLHLQLKHLTILQAEMPLDDLALVDEAGTRYPVVVDPTCPVEK